MLRYLLLSLLVLLGAPLSSAAETTTAATASAVVPAGGWKPGVHFNVLKDVPQQKSMPSVSVTEMFWLGCPHCFTLEPEWVQWCENKATGGQTAKPAYVECRSLHVVWKNVRFYHAQFFYTLEALGRGDLRKKAFETIHLPLEKLGANQNGFQLDAERKKLAVSGDAQKSFELQREFAVANGVKAEDFTKMYHSPQVHERLERVEEIGKSWQITGVPSLVVAGRFFTKASMAGGHPQLFALLSDLAACAHDESQCGRVGLAQQTSATAQAQPARRRE